jgi:hypothetical protein
MFFVVQNEAQNDNKSFNAKYQAGFSVAHLVVCVTLATPGT